MKNILWHSNSINAPSGYGNQTKLFASLIKGHPDYDVAVSAFYGREGNIVKDGETDILELPRYKDPYGNDIVPGHYGYFKADAVVSLIDPFVLNPMIWGQLNWAAWVPIDCEPMGDANADVVRHAKRVWAMSRFGERMLKDAGFDNVDYVPHGIDTETFTPIDRKFARAELEKFAQAEIGDKYLVVTVAANTGAPSRKNFQGMMAAFAKFHEMNPESVWYIHTEANGYNGENLHKMAQSFGIANAVIFPRTYQYTMNLIEPSFLNKIYNAGDVFLLLSMGEGFGIPIMEAQAAGCPVIVTDGSAMSELCLSGKLVHGWRHAAWGARQGCFWRLADVGEAVIALESMRLHRHSGVYRERAREKALAYDHKTVFETYMLPALEKLVGTEASDKGLSTTVNSDPTPSTGSGEYMPDVSVIIPTLNGEATIERAVRSVFAQSGVIVECIVVDDGSTDHTGDILETLKADCSEQLRYVQFEQNLGQVPAMNDALNNASGRWVLFIGDDDWLEPDSLRKLVATGDEAPDTVGFVYGDLQYHGRRTDRVKAKAYKREDYNRHFPAGTSVIWRREISTKHGLEYRTLHDGKTGHGEDFDMILQIIKAGYVGQAVPGALVVHYTLAGDRATAWLHANQDDGPLAEFKRRHPEFIGRL